METILLFALLAALIGFPIYALNMWTGRQRPTLPRWKRIIGAISGLWIMSWIIGPFILNWMQ